MTELGWMWQQLVWSLNVGLLDEPINLNPVVFWPTVYTVFKIPWKNLLKLQVISSNFALLINKEGWCFTGELDNKEGVNYMWRVRCLSFFSSH